MDLPFNGIGAIWKNTLIINVQAGPTYHGRPNSFYCRTHLDGPSRNLVSARICSGPNLIIVGFRLFDGLNGPDKDPSLGSKTLTGPGLEHFWILGFGHLSSSSLNLQAWASYKPCWADSGFMFLGLCRVDMNLDSASQMWEALFCTNPPKKNKIYDLLGYVCPTRNLGWAQTALQNEPFNFRIRKSVIHQ